MSLKLAVQLHLGLWLLCSGKMLNYSRGER